MPVGVIFWVLMIIWAVVGFGLSWLPGDARVWGFGGNLLLFILLFLLGWKAFGFIVHG